MPLYLISYDLSDAEPDDYRAIEDAIVAASAGAYWHYLESTWMVMHPGPAWEIEAELNPTLREDDRLLVVRLTGETAWKSKDKVGGKWIKDHAPLA